MSIITGSIKYLGGVKKDKVSISLDADLLKLVDMSCKRLGWSRSHLIENCLKITLEPNNKLSEIRKSLILESLKEKEEEKD